jgi:hypothetical protein
MIPIIDALHCQDNGVTNLDAAMVNRGYAYHRLTAVTSVPSIDTTDCSRVILGRTMRVQ